MEFAKFERVSLKSHPDFNEKWVQDRIAEDPKILGLGDVFLKDKERIQPRAGRLDLLLQEEGESNRRYEVELQLGATDESHIIRTIEYWDIERKRYPQYEHTAVIIAEDITSRFLNVISLFNGTIPLVAIQMTAQRYENKIGLSFITILNQMPFGLVDEDEEMQEVTNREYWENKGRKKTLAIVDELLGLIKQYDASLELNYTKHYISMAKNGRANNFIVLHPKKEFLRFEVRLENTTEMTARIENAGLDLISYDARYRMYHIRLMPADVNKHKAFLSEIIKEAYTSSGKE